MDSQSNPSMNLGPMLNPLRMILAIVVSVGTGFLTFFMVYDDFTLCVSLLISLGTVSTLEFIIFFIYRYETKYQIAQLEEKIEIELRKDV